MRGTVGIVWRRTCGQFWGSFKENLSSREEGVLRTEKYEKEVAQQLVNDSRRKKESLTNEKTLVRRRMGGESGRKKEKGM